MKKIFKFIGNTMFYTIIIFLIFICIVMIKSKIKGEQANIFGYEFYGVLTGSMSPTIEVGDLIIVKEIKTEEIKTEDIITFASKSSENVTTHRVKEILNEDEIKFITQGDANNTIDPEPISEKLLIGKVTNIIPKAGIAISTIKENMIIVLIGIIFIFGIAYFSLNNSKKSSEL